MQKLLQLYFFRCYRLIIGSILTLFLLFFYAPLWAQSKPQLDLPRVTLSINTNQIQVQVASTPEQQSTGLMWRTEMLANDGMLFVFPRSAIQCFWMRNTYLPLSAAFIADDGRIINIADMQPLSLDDHCSVSPARYVLEMHQGWFITNQIAPGDIIVGLP